MEVINDLLNYNGLKIVQNTNWFSFSIDSVLLANFVKVNNKQKIIDFCSGNAPIPLFLSTKISGKIIGVELQKEVYDLALKSIKINKLEDRIEILNEDVRKLADMYETDTFDLITCNPPYFKVKTDSNTNFDTIKSIARHELYLNLDDIFKCAKKLLKNNGRIAMVHRTDRLIDIITCMKENNIEPKRMQFVYPFKNSKSNLVLIEGAKNGQSGLILEKNIIVHNEDGSYTDYVKKVFNGGDINEN